MRNIMRSPDTIITVAIDTDYDDAAVCLRIWWRHHKVRRGQLRQLSIARNIVDGYRFRRRIYVPTAVYGCKEWADGTFHYYAN